MSSLIASLGIDRLGPADRLQLVEELLDSLDTGREPPPLTEAQRCELRRRLAALMANPNLVSPKEEGAEFLQEPDWKTNSDGAFLAAAKSEFVKNAALLRRLA